MGRLKKLSISFLVLITFIAIFHIVVSSIEMGSEEVELKLSNCANVFFVFPNSSMLELRETGLYVLPEEFNISQIYANLWLTPNRDLPVRFVYIPRQYVVPHLTFPNGSEIVLNNLIIQPWGGNIILSSPLGGFKEGGIYEAKNSLEYLREAFHDKSYQEIVDYASMEDLTRLIHNLLNKYDSFTISFYAPSTYTFLTYPRELPLVFDKLFLQLTFEEKENVTLLYASIPQEETLGTYKLTYDARVFDWYSSLKTVDLVLSILAIILIIVFSLAYLFKREGPKKTLTILGLTLLLLGAYGNFNIDSVSNGYLLLHFYSYFTDGYTNVPPEVMWHVSKAMVEGARLEDSFEPKAINWIVLVGDELTEMAYGPVSGCFCGMGEAALKINLFSGGEELYYDHYVAEPWMLYAGSASSRTSGLRTLTIPEFENRQIVMDANINVNLFLSSGNLRGGILLDNFNLCKFIMRSEEGNLLLENFILPNTYVMPRLEIVYSERIAWVNQFLSALGIFVMMSLLITWLNRKYGQAFKSRVLRAKTLFSPHQQYMKNILLSLSRKRL
jgi:hypothetical protein